MRPSAWGVELTGGAVRAVRVQRRGQKFAIVDVVDQPVSPPGEGAEELSAHLPDAVGRALTDLLQARRGTLGDAIFVALPVFGAKHGRVDVPVTDPARAPGLLEFELHQAIAVDLDGWIVRTTPPRRRESQTTSCDYFAQRRTLVSSFVADLRRFGLPLDGLMPGPLALARYVDAEWPHPGRRLAIECQRTRTDLLVLDGERDRHWRSLPFGCGTLADLPVGAASRERDATRTATQLVRELREAHATWFGPHDGRTLDRVILLGEGTRHEELRRALERELGQPIVTPHLPRRFSVSSRAAPHHPLQFGTALGLAMAALSTAPEPWSLLPASRTRSVARTLPAWSAALFVIAIGLLATGTLAQRERTTLRTQLAEIQKKTDFGAHTDWAAALATAERATEETRALIAEAALVRRRLPFPGALLKAMSDPAIFFRLIDCELVPGDSADSARLVFEVDEGLVGAIASIRAFLAEKAALSVTSVEEQRSDDRVLRLTIVAAMTHGSSS